MLSRLRLGFCLSSACSSGAGSRRGREGAGRGGWRTLSYTYPLQASLRRWIVEAAVNYVEDLRGSVGTSLPTSSELAFYRSRIK